MSTHMTMPFSGGFLPALTLQMGASLATGVTQAQAPFSEIIAAIL